jgi:hypothetical protein
MGGGVLDLQAFGAQDLFLTGSPQITFLKQVWRRHTNFGMESIAQGVSGNVDFGRRVSCSISKSADMVHKMILQVEVPALTRVSGTGAVRWVDRLGHALLKAYSLEISGHVVDQQYGEWLEIWNALTLPASQSTGYARMIGHVTQLHASATYKPYTLYIPLQFWFCQNAGLALPLVALTATEIKVYLEFRPLAELIIQQTAGDIFSGKLMNASIYADMIYLDTDERQKFAAGAHEYLVTQLQTPGSEQVLPKVANMSVYFSHPVKFLAFVMQRSEVVGANVNQWFNFTDTLQARSVAAGNFSDPIELLDSGVNQGTAAAPAYADGGVSTAKLLINSKDRFSTRNGEYFNYVQCNQWFASCPLSPGIYVYSFALKPTDVAQPSGSLNFTRVDTASWQFTYNPAMFVTSTGGSDTAYARMYALNVNVLKVFQGQAAMAFST